MIRVASDDLERLAARERQVFELYGDGKRASEIAKIMKISLKTVSAHLLHICEKLGVRNTAQLRVLAGILCGEYEITGA
jgi:DNA-binding CsgD family transcriptional regulator